MSLKPWYKVVTPREDLREGKPLDASEFAVHLDRVRDGSAHEDYQKAERFFEKTFLTKNLLDLAAQVTRRLSGEKTETSPVYNMATQFGGGKTHALTLLYHLAHKGPEARNLQGAPRILQQSGMKEFPQARTAVFVGTEFDSITGRGGEDGTPNRKTPWGEVAFQLMGDAGFREVEQHEKQMTAPSGEVIRRFLPKDAPCLILMDELMNYVSRNRKSGLSTQLYNFLQNLSEEARASDHVALVASIPASELEMSAEDHSDYDRFKKLLDRLGKAVIMSAESETSEIVRRRLFEWDAKAINQEGRVLLSKDALATCKEYAEWVADHRQQFPAWFADHGQDAFEVTYPFHPSVLSVFERKWQELPRFQQTRGALRLLALWVSHAYQQGFKGAEKDPLIGLGTAPLEDSQFRAAAFEQLGESRLEGALTTDICGKKESHAVRLDAEAVDTLKKERLHKKAATVIFFESNGGQGERNQFATIPEIRMSVGHPALDLGHVDTVLEALTDACYYLSPEGNQYHFSLKENLNKRFADRRAGVREEEIDALVRGEIEKAFPATEGVERVFCPEKSGQIPDRPVITLAIMDPEQSLQDSEKVLEAIEIMTREHGSSARTYKSALVWVVAEGSGPLREEARKLIAWENIESEGLSLDDAQERQLEANIKRGKRDLRESVWRTYKNVYLLGKDNTLQHVDLGIPNSSAAENMCKLILTELRHRDEVQKEVSPRFLTRNWPPAFIEWSTKAVRDAFFASPQFPRLLNPDTIKETIVRGVSDGILAYVGKSPDGGYSPFFYKKSLDSSQVEISEDMFIIMAKEAEKHIKPPELTRIEVTPASVHLKPQTKQTFIARGLDQFGRDIDVGKITWTATGGNIDEDGMFLAGGDEGNFIVCAKAGKITSTSEVSIAREPDLKPTPPPPPPPATKTLKWSGEISPQKWMNFYTKVLTGYVREGNVRIKVEFEVEAAGGVSEQKIEETKAALRELGLNDDVASSSG